MRLPEKLAIGQRLHITWQGRVYASLLLDHGSSYLDIGIIQSLGQPVYLLPGAVVTVAFGVPDNGYYRFTTTVVGEITKPGLSIRLAYPTEIERIQQRMYYRLPLSIPFSFRVINDLRSHRARITCQGVTVDISGGGLQFTSSEALHAGDNLEIDIQIGGQILATGLVGIVLRTTKHLGENLQAGIQFVNISREQEESIIRFVFREQIRRRQMQQ